MGFVVNETFLSKKKLEMALKALNIMMLDLVLVVKCLFCCIYRQLMVHASVTLSPSFSLIIDHRPHFSLLPFQGTQCYEIENNCLITVFEYSYFLLPELTCVLTLVRCPFHPGVTIVAHKRPRSFCQKCRWQVTPKHA